MLVRLLCWLSWHRWNELELVKSTVRRGLIELNHVETLSVCAHCHRSR